MLASLQAKVLLLLITLIGLINPTSRVGEVKEYKTQDQFEIDLVEEIQNQENSSVSNGGKYSKVPSTVFTAEYPSTYRVDEWVKGNNESRGYTIYIDHYKNEQVLNATTSKIETIPVLKRKTIER